VPPLLMANILKVSALIYILIYIYSTKSLQTLIFEKFGQAPLLKRIKLLLALRLPRPPLPQ
jgi:hypothetical protein